MKSTSTEGFDLMERSALVKARCQREQYLHGFDELLASLDEAEPASLEEIRQLFATHEPPDMPSLSAEIEAMREER